MVEHRHELRPEDMGARMRAVRELTGASTHEIAKSAGLSRRELEAAERGAKRLSPEQLHALAGALSVDPDVLVGIGQAPDVWDDLPTRVKDRPRALPVNLPNPERRIDHVTRGRIEQSWRDVREELDEALATCERLISAGSGDDVRRLLGRLEQDLQQLKSRRSFQRSLADHERALQKARGTGGNIPGQPLASSANEAR